MYDLRVFLKLALIALDVAGAGVPFLPQSPRQSILNEHPEDARSVIAQMHAISIDDPLVQAYMDEIAEKIVEEKVSGAGYLDCFNFRNDLKTGQRTLIGFVMSCRNGVRAELNLTFADVVCRASNSSPGKMHIMSSLPLSSLLILVPLISANFIFVCSYQTVLLCHLTNA